MRKIWAFPKKGVIELSQRYQESLRRRGTARSAGDANDAALIVADQVSQATSCIFKVFAKSAEGFAIPPAFHHVTFRALQPHTIAISAVGDCGCRMSLIARLVQMWGLCMLRYFDHYNIALTRLIRLCVRVGGFVSCCVVLGRVACAGCAKYLWANIGFTHRNLRRR